MRTTTRELYYCDYCNKMYLQEHWAAKHEPRCPKNPANARPCFRCEYLVKADCNVWVQHGAWLDTVEKELLYCNAKHIFLHTPLNELKGRIYDVVDYVNDPMPLECDLFEGRE